MATEMRDDPVNVMWRTGRKVGRTIYACFGDRPMDDLDVLIGVMDTPALANEAVHTHNAAVDLRARGF